MKLQESLNLAVWALVLFLIFLFWLFIQGKKEEREFVVSCEIKGGKVRELYKNRLCLTVDGRILE